MNKRNKIAAGTVISAAALAALITVPALASSAASSAAGTVSGCVTARHQLAQVTTGTALACPPGSTAVSWPVSEPVTPPTTSPPTTSPPTTSPPTTAPPTTAPPTTAPPAGSACVTSAKNGSCGPYADAAITGSDGHDTYVLNNMWNGQAGSTQTLTATGPGSWSVLADITPPGSTAVQTYPDTQQLYTTTSGAPDPLSGFSSLTSSFTESMATGAGTSAEAAYDIWLGQSAATSYADEVMIWNDQENRGTCGGATPVASNIAFGGSGGVPDQDWDLCKYGSSELIWYPAAGNEQAGSVDVLGMLAWLETSGHLPAGSGLNQIDYGFELCSTPGPETFAVTSFGIASS
jgi:hypothetical protein